jgi:hypothetical protein
MMRAVIYTRTGSGNGETQDGSLSAAGRSLRNAAGK